MHVKKEQFWPFVLSTAVVIVLIIYRVNYSVSKNLDSALDGIITTASLIVGFFGAILPVIISMRDDSKFARYVFQHDRRKLFLQYIKQTLACGILLISISVVLYFQSDFQKKYTGTVVFYIAAWLFVAFMACTFRSVNYMLTLVFKTDDEFMDLDRRQPDLLKSESSDQAKRMQKDLLKEQRNGK